MQTEIVSRGLECSGRSEGWGGDIIMHGPALPRIHGYVGNIVHAQVSRFCALNFPSSSVTEHFHDHIGDKAEVAQVSSVKISHKASQVGFTGWIPVGFTDVICSSWYLPSLMNKSASFTITVNTNSRY